MRDVPILRYSVLSPLFYVSFVVAIIYGLSNRFGQTTGGLWDVVLQVYLSSSVFAFAVLPMWLIFLLVHNRWQSRPEFLIRHGSFLTAWWSGVKEAFVYWTAFTFAWIIGLYASAIGLPTRPQLVGSGLIVSTINSGVHPIWLLIGQIAVNTVFMVATAALIRVFDTSRFAILAQTAVAIAIFAWFAAGASGAVSDDSLFSLTRYVQVILLITDPPAAVIALVLEVVFVAALALTARVNDTAAERKSRSRWLNLSSVLWIVSAFLIAIRLLAHSTLPLKDAAALALSGNAGTAIDALVWSFVYLGPVVALIIVRMPSSPELLDLQMLRAGSVGGWVARTFRRDCLAVIPFSLTVALPGVIAYYTLGGSGVDNWGDAILLTWALLINVSLHTALMVAAATFGVVIFRSATGAFGVGVVAFFFTLVPQTPSTWWPFGAANIARVAFGAGPVLLGAVSIVATTMLILLATAAVPLFQRLPKKREIRWGR